MPVEFLTDEEAAAYRRYVGAPSQEELDRMFFLDDDKALIARRRSLHMMLGFALQLVTVRYLGIFLVDPLDVPTEVTDYVPGSWASPIGKRVTSGSVTPYTTSVDVNHVDPG